MQGIGLDNNDTNDSSHTFKLAGSESWGIPVTPASTTADGWSHYVVDVGARPPRCYGNMTCLFFANDRSGDAQDYFRNVKIYEAPRSFRGSLTSAHTSGSTPIKATTYG